MTAGVGGNTAKARRGGGERDYVPFAIGGRDPILYRLQERSVARAPVAAPAAAPPVPVRGKAVAAGTASLPWYLAPNARRLAPLAAAGFLVSAGIGAVLVAKLTAESEIPRSVLDPDPVKAEALRKGAAQITMPDPRDDRFMVTVRFYPDAKGEARPEVVDRFRTADFEAGGKWVPTPRMPWIRNW